MIADVTMVLNIITVLDNTAMFNEDIRERRRQTIKPKYGPTTRRSSTYPTDIIGDQ